MPLQVIDADLLQAKNQFDGFDRLRDSPLSRNFGNFVNRSDHGMIKLAVGQFANEAAVDLDQVDWKLLEVVERRQPLAEVIQRNLAAEVAQRAEEAARFLETVYRGRFGNFEAQNARLDIVCLDLVKQLGQHNVTIHRLPRQVDMPGSNPGKTGSKRLDALQRIADHPPVDRACDMIVFGCLHEYAGRMQFTVGIFKSDQKFATPIVTGCR